MAIVGYSCSMELGTLRYFFDFIGLYWTFLDFIGLYWTFWDFGDGVRTRERVQKIMLFWDKFAGVGAYGSIP